MVNNNKKNGRLNSKKYKYWEKSYFVKKQWYKKRCKTDLIVTLNEILLKVSWPTGNRFS